MEQPYTQRMRQLRQELGLSTARAAVGAGMDPATWNRIEKGHVSPNLRTLSSIAEGLGVSVVELLEEQPHPKAQAPLWSDDSSEERGERVDIDALDRALAQDIHALLSWHLESHAAKLERAESVRERQQANKDINDVGLTLFKLLFGTLAEHVPGVPGAELERAWSPLAEQIREFAPDFNTASRNAELEEIARRETTSTTQK